MTAATPPPNFSTTGLSATTGLPRWASTGSEPLEDREGPQCTSGQPFVTFSPSSRVIPPEQGDTDWFWFPFSLSVVKAKSAPLQIHARGPAYGTPPGFACESSTPLRRMSATVHSATTAWRAILDEDTDEDEEEAPDEWGVCEAEDLEALGLGVYRTTSRNAVTGTMKATARSSVSGRFILRDGGYANESW